MVSQGKAFVSTFGNLKVLLVSTDSKWSGPLAELLSNSGAQVSTALEEHAADEYDMVIRCGRPTRHTAPTARESGRKHSRQCQTPTVLFQSSTMAATVRRAEQVAHMDSPVLITGETGTGKELLAQTIHARSPRASGPFVAVNVAAIPPSLLESELFGYAGGAFTGAKREGHRGKFAQAEGGTLFLDEIGDLPLDVQVKLLRVLESRTIDPVGGSRSEPIDVRILAATHQPLLQMVQQGRFRTDLYYRLNVLNVHLPPLRDRGNDAVEIAGHYLSQLAARYGRPVPVLSPETVRALQSHRWPGNIRELKNAMEFAFVFADGPVITPDLLPEEVRGSLAAGVRPEERALDRQEILRMLAEVGGNKAEAARRLHISRAWLYTKLREFGINSSHLVWR